MITSEKLSEVTVFRVERYSDDEWRHVWVVPDYDTARAWAKRPNRRVVMVRTMTFLCEDDQTSIAAS